VDSLEKADLDGIALTVVVVDNTERPDSRELFTGLERAPVPVVCVKSPSNAGYLGAVRLGLGEYARRVGRVASWTLVSNVDVRFGDPGFFQRLALASRPEDVGVIAPSIWSDTYKRDRNPHLLRRPSPLAMRFYASLYSHFYVANLYIVGAWLASRVWHAARGVLDAAGRPETRSPVLREARDIYAANGSCFALSAAFFQRGGNFDYPCFLFGEEIFVAETARGLGLRVVYDPTLRVYHDDHVSTGLLRSRQVVSYMRASSVFLARRYFPLRS